MERYDRRRPIILGGDNMVKLWKNIVELNGKEVGFLKLEDAVISPYNVRQSESDLEVKEIKGGLAENIKKYGLQQIPVSTSAGHIYIGGRRFVAHNILGEEYMLCERRDATPQEQIITSWSENYQRKSSHYLDEGKAFTLLMEMEKLKIAELARKLDVVPSYVGDKVRIYEYLAQLGELIRKSESNENRENIVTYEKARLLAVEDIPNYVKEELINKIIDDGLSFPDLQKIIDAGREKRFELESSDHSIKQILEEKHSNLFDAELRVEQIKNEIRELQGQGPIASKHRFALSSLFEKNKFKPELNAQYRALGNAFFSYYSGKADRWDIIVYGELSKQSLEDKDPFTKEQVREYGDLMKILRKEDK